MAHLQVAGHLKAPEGRRTPGRFALFGRRRNSRQRFGLRRSTAAFASRVALEESHDAKRLKQWRISGSRVV